MADAGLRNGTLTVEINIFFFFKALLSKNKQHIGFLESKD